MKRFISSSVVFVFPIVAILVSVNWYVDAASIFSRSGVERKIAEYLVEGHDVGNVRNIDERMLQKHIIALSAGVPDVIVLGSSRVMMIGARYSGKQLFNHGVSGCSIEDMMAIYQIYSDRGRIPGKIVIGVDPWIFNANRDQERWRSLRNEVRRFLDTETQPTTNWTACAQIVSPSYFQASVNTFFASQSKKSGTSPCPLKDRTEFGDELVRLADGTLFNKGYEASLDEVGERIKTYISGNVYSLEGYESLSDRDIGRFDRLIQRMLSDGIDVEFIMVPYPPEVYHHLLQNPKYAQVFKAAAHVRDYAREHGIPVTGSWDPSGYNLTNQHFYDGMHLNAEGVGILLRGQRL